MDIRVYKDALDLVEKEIRKLTMKGELTATEVCNLKEAVTAASTAIESFVKVVRLCLNCFHRFTCCDDQIYQLS